MHPFLAAAVTTSLIHDRTAAAARAARREVRPSRQGPRLA